MKTQLLTLFSPILISSQDTAQAWPFKVSSSTFRLPSVPTWTQGDFPETWPVKGCQTSQSRCNSVSSQTWPCQHHRCPGAIHSISGGYLLRSCPVKEACTRPDAENCANSKICTHYAAAVQRVKGHLPQNTQICQRMSRPCQVRTSYT